MTVVLIEPKNNAQNLTKLCELLHNETQMERGLWVYNVKRNVEEIKPTLMNS